MEYNIGKDITDYMEENCIKQATLAKIINYDPGNLNRLLRKKDLSLDMIIKISVALRFNFLRDVSYQLTEEIMKDEM